MDEQKNADRVRVLGVYVDPLKVDRAVLKTTRYLDTHKLEYIVFANTPAALLGQEEGNFSDYIGNAALVLPGDSNIEDAVEAGKWLGEGKSYQAEYFRRLFNRLNQQHANIYAMIEKENQSEKFRQIMKEKYHRIHVEDIIWQDETSVDSMVNAINSLSPDILFICGNHERMSRFLEEHACKVNASLCVCMEEIVTDEETNLDLWAHVGKLYKIWMNITEWISRFIHDSLFRKQMKQEKQMEETEKTEETEDREEKVGKM